MENKVYIETTKYALSPTICGSKYKREDLAKARPINDTARRHIAAYVTSHSARIQVWALEVGHADKSVFVCVPVEEVAKLSVSAKASLIFDDSDANRKMRRLVDIEIPRTGGHGIAATFMCAKAAGLKPECWRTGIANIAYTDLPIGDDATRSRAIEELVEKWAQTWPNVKYTRYMGGLKGNAYDTFCHKECVAKEAYTPDIMVRFKDESVLFLEVKGRCGRQPAPQKFRDEWGLE